MSIILCAPYSNKAASFSGGFHPVGIRFLVELILLFNSLRLLSQRVWFEFQVFEANMLWVNLAEKLCQKFCVVCAPWCFISDVGWLICPPQLSNLCLNQSTSTLVFLRTCVRGEIWFLAWIVGPKVVENLLHLIHATNLRPFHPFYLFWMEK